MFSKSCKYAILAVMYLAVNTHEESKLGVVDLSEALDIPKHFLAKILQRLTKKKLVSSSKGRHGGFYLNETNRASSLIEVIYAIDGPGIFHDCILGLSECSGENPCPFHKTALNFRTAFFNDLQNDSITQVAERIDKHNFTLKILKK